jgi:tyrosine-protein kinase Etk/Wzc
MSEGLPTLNTGTDEGGEISLLDLFATLYRRKRMILFVTCLGAIGALCYTIGSLFLPSDRSYMPNLYEPKAILLVNDDAGSGGLTSMLASSGLGNLASMAGVPAGKSYGQLAVFIAKSNPILDVLIDTFDLVARYKISKSPRAEARSRLLEQYSVIYDDKTGTISISFSDRDPELARDLVNHAVELLDRRFTTIGGNRNQTKKEQLEGKLVDVQAEMRRLEVDIQAFQQKYGVITIESLATEQIAVVARVRSELIMKEMEIKTYGDISRVEDPALRRMQAERDNLSKLLGELEKGFSEYEKVLPSLRDLPKLAIEFSHLQRDLIIQEKIFELLTQQYELTKLSLAGEDPVIQILELAEVPDKKAGPSRGMICIVATVIAFFVSTLTAFLIDAVGNIRRDPVAMAKFKGVKR